MRALFILLLLANLTVAGYAWYASHQDNPDAALLNQQINADKIRVTAPRPMVLPARPKATCLGMGYVRRRRTEARAVRARRVEPAPISVSSHDVQVLVGLLGVHPAARDQARGRAQDRRTANGGASRNTTRSNGQGPDEERDLARASSRPRTPRTSIWRPCSRRACARPARAAASIV